MVKSLLWKATSHVIHQFHCGCMGRWFTSVEKTRSRLMMCMIHYGLRETGSNEMIWSHPVMYGRVRLENSAVIFESWFIILYKVLNDSRGFIIIPKLWDLINNKIYVFHYSSTIIEVTSVGVLTVLRPCTRSRVNDERELLENQKVKA